LNWEGKMRKGKTVSNGGIWGALAWISIILWIILLALRNYDILTVSTIFEILLFAFSVCALIFSIIYRRNNRIPSSLLALVFSVIAMIYSLMAIYAITYFD
jgi:hypothetical protein